MEMSHITVNHTGYEWGSGAAFLETSFSQILLQRIS